MHITLVLRRHQIAIADPDEYFTCEKRIFDVKIKQKNAYN